ncbi:MAG: FdhF/YdeP family oxidoreductase [Gammaproteobacteria bacterium]|nr:FdhF/YdeP family oxidoreductase [Gammaproteobacteria bacterium]
MVSIKKAGGFPSIKSTVLALIKSKRVRANMKNLLKVNQTDGFDCPGCAWGDNKSGTFQFCENGAKAVAWESTENKIGADFFAEYSVTRLLNQSDYWLEYQGRLAEPLKYNSATDHFEPIEWQQAFDFIADKLNTLAPNEIELYTSGRASNEVAYLYQLFGRTLGTNNFPDCSNMCHEASGVALNESIGIGKGTVTLEDFDHADAIFVYGQNPGTNHPRMMNALRKAARNGCKIVSFNNLKEVALERFASPQDPVELLTPAATEISHMYLTPKLGGDMAAVRGMVKYLLSIDTPLNKPFIDEHTQGLDDYIKVVNDTDWEQIVEQSGLSKNEIQQTAVLFASSNNVISTWAMGLTQHKHSVDTIREIANLHLLFGQIGHKGAGLCPVRGHSNVQGNRTVGINEKPKAEFIESLEKEFGISLPKQSGHNVFHALKSLHQRQSKALICLGGNIAAAASDSNFTFEAVRRSELNVHIATKLNRSHLLVSKDALILPCLGRTEIDRQKSGEQAITVEDTFSMVHASHGGTEPEGLNVKSETAIIANIAQTTLGDKPVKWTWLAEDYGRIRDLIAKTIPGFDNFNEKIKQPGGFYLGNSARELKWNTHSNKANFSTEQLPDALFPLEVTEQIAKQKQTVFTLQTLRSHDQYNTTIYGMNDRYRGVSNERKVLFINKKDAKKQKLADGDAVSLTSIWPDGVERKVDGFKIKTYDIPKGNLAAYYPETNPLVPLDSVGDKSYTPTSKSVAVFIEKSKTFIATH